MTEDWTLTPTPEDIQRAYLQGRYDGAMEQIERQIKDCESRIRRIDSEGMIMAAVVVGTIAMLYVLYHFSELLGWVP